jgi:hypothetical protein
VPQVNHHSESFKQTHSNKQGAKIKPTQENDKLIDRYFGAISGKPKTVSLVNEYVDDAVLAHHIEIFESAFPAYERIADDQLGVLPVPA